MRKVNKNVEGYDVDLEYRRMLVEIDHANATASIHGGGCYIDVFRGTNFVRFQSRNHLYSTLTRIQRRLVISFLPWHWQVAMGVPIITTYSSYFYDMAGLANPFHGTIATK